MSRETASASPSIEASEELERGRGATVAAPELARASSPVAPAASTATAGAAAATGNGRLPWSGLPEPLPSQPLAGTSGTSTTSVAAAGSNGRLVWSGDPALLRRSLPSTARHSRKLRSSSLPFARGSGATIGAAAGSGGGGGSSSAGRTSLLNPVAAVANRGRTDRAVVGAAAAAPPAANAGAAYASAGAGGLVDTRGGANARGGGQVGGTAGGGNWTREAHEDTPSRGGRSSKVATPDGMRSKPKPRARMARGTEELPRPAVEIETDREPKKRRRESGANDLRVGGFDGSVSNNGRGVPSSNERGRPLLDAKDTREGETAVERQAAEEKEQAALGTPAQRGPGESHQETLDRIAFQKRQEFLDAVRIKVRAV